MNTLVHDNMFYIYFFACVVILNYNVFDRHQKLMLIQITTFSMAVMGGIGAKALCISLTVVLFVLEEYLTADKVKIQLVTKFWTKLLDYGYNFVFQNSGVWTLLALALNSHCFLFLTEQKLKNHIFGASMGIWAKGLSVLVFAFGMHRLSTQKFEISSFSEMKSRFESVPFRSADYSNADLQQKMDLLVDIEDKSYFFRENSYNWISKEFIRYRFGRWKLSEPSERKTKPWYIFLKKCIRFIREYGIIFLLKKGIKELRQSFYGIRLRPVYWLKLIFKRGYATLEMQLIRNIGIEKGYENDKHILRRKLFEVIYSYIFFTGLKHYYEVIRFKNRKNFKKFILYVYLYSVDTKINGRTIDPLLSIFGDEKSQIPEKGWETMPLELFFVLYLGLNHRHIYPKRVALYNSIILKYHMNTGMIFSLAEKIAGKEIMRLSVDAEEDGQEKINTADKEQLILWKENYPIYVINQCILPVVEGNVYYGPMKWPSYGLDRCRSFAGMVYLKIWGVNFTSFADTKDNLIPMDASLSERKITPERVQYYISRSYPGSAIRICDEIYGNDLQGKKRHSQILLDVLENGLVLYESNNRGTEIMTYTWESYAEKYEEYQFFKYIKCPLWGLYTR